MMEAAMNEPIQDDLGTEEHFSPFGTFLGLIAAGALLADRAPVAWQWYLRNFWWDADMRASWSLLSGWPMILWWGVVTTAAWLLVALVVLAAVASVVDWLRGLRGRRS